MELKQTIVCERLYQYDVLIVPYGIETTHARPPDTRQTVLIVPYGIETHLFVVLAFLPAYVLIVPYGIETISRISCPKRRRKVLIVPYGIETRFYPSPSLSSFRFNRTLWN